MTYETIDLYEYFSLPKGRNAAGTLTVYARECNPEIKEKLRPAMLVIPGGGYEWVSRREAEPVAMEFLYGGYSVFVLDYTVHTPHPVPLLEAAMAVAYIRENAEKYYVDRAHVGAVGFSAGGHLCATLATMYGEACVKEALGNRAALVRPDAVVLSYAVITTGLRTHGGTAKTISGGDAALQEKMSLEKRVTKDSSPAFLWHTVEDDCVPVQNALLMAEAYLKAGVPFDLHVFESGGHGMSTVNGEVTDGDYPEAVARAGKWVELALSWLASRGFKVRVK